MALAADARRNRSGIQTKPVYEAEDVRGDRPPPGREPFTRGIHATMYSERVWSKRQLIGVDSPETFNERQRALLESGQTAVNLTICNSTYRGVDVDQVPVELVGTCGTPVNCLEDVAIAFEGLSMGDLSFGLNDPSPFTLAAMLLVHAEEQGVGWGTIRGTSNQSDILSHYVANHMFLRLPPRPGIRVLVDHVHFMRDNVPGWNPISVVGQHMQQAGATPLQALAFTLCTAIEYVTAVCASGLKVDEFANRVTFFHDVSMSFFEEVAKLRAQRSMWASILRERFGARDERTLKFKVHTQTSGADLTRQQPLNNIARVTIQALAAVLGGTQSLHTDSFDEVLATPTEDAARVALATQHILSDETGIPDVVDPLGGSYYVEALTDEMEARAWAIVKEVDERGGMLEACEDGFVQDEIGRSAWEFHESVERGERRIVGLTHYRDEDDAPHEVPVQRVSPRRVAGQIERVRASREQRDQTRAAAARARIKDLATNPGDNCFDAVVDGARARLTHGEIVAAMRAAFGFGRPRVTV
jgi:methylmalonyl-CoA mutase N-terminal domain/subunit